MSFPSNIFVTGCCNVISNKEQFPPSLALGADAFGSTQSLGSPFTGHGWAGKGPEKSQELN